MSKPDVVSLTLHEDPDLFRAAVNFTAKTTTFAPRLIEKDYFCTVLLDYLAAGDELVFKGGTCLAKVHADFYRLSEDLDFVIPMSADCPRAERSRKTKALKEAIASLPRRLPVFLPVEPLTGANNSTQYTAVVGYTSLVSQGKETIKIECGLREPLILPAMEGRARTILLDPASTHPMVEPVTLRCISRIEAFAEKFRAALSRREVAVRDFYDIDYAVRRLALRPEEGELIELVRQKMAVPGNDLLDVSERRVAALRRQVDSQLRPVLRAEDFEAFDLARAFRVVTQMATKIIA
jgi:predicted nucleotidyltransferase component of viral defense system